MRYYVVYTVELPSLSHTYHTGYAGANIDLNDYLSEGIPVKMIELPVTTPIVYSVWGYGKHEECFDFFATHREAETYRLTTLEGFGILEAWSAATNNRTYY